MRPKRNLSFPSCNGGQTQTPDSIRGYLNTSLLEEMKDVCGHCSHLGDFRGHLLPSMCYWKLCVEQCTETFARMWCVVWIPKMAEKKTVPRVELRNARLAAGLSKAELAKRIGVGVKTVERWEYGTTIPYPHHRPPLANISE